MSYKMRLDGRCCALMRQNSLLCMIVVVCICASWFVSVIGQSLPHKNSVLMPVPTKYKSLNNQEAFQRRLMREREVIPPMSNAIPGEPSCEELRAMWRYYKRQSRAELTNEIPQFGSNLFWDTLPVTQQQQPQMSSFGSVKGRSKAGRMRLNKGQKNPAYGQVMLKPERDRSRKPRPMEEVARLMGKPSKSMRDSSGGGENKTGGTSKSPPPEPIVRLSPPPTPTKESSLQKIKEVFREERIREKGPAMRTNDDNGKAFGRIILSPPRGMDGRVANKPRELMTPFEKIRFGHADDILDDETSRPNIMSKRRTLPLLKYHLHKGKQTFTRDSRTDAFFRQPLNGYSQQHPLVYLHSPVIDYDNNEHSPDYSWGPNDIDSSPWNDNLYQSDHQTSFTPNTLATEVSSSPTCKEVEGQLCNVNADCSCVGFGLYRCFANECQILSLHSSTGVVAEKSDTSGESSAESFWHSGPLDSNRLGLWEDSPIYNINSDTVDSSKSESSADEPNIAYGFGNIKVVSGSSRDAPSVQE